MTFNSYVFLFVFLPIVIAGYYLLTRLLGDQRPALTWLVLASLVFYGSQGFGYLAVLAVSVIGNFLIAWLLSTRPVGSRARTTVLIGGIAANLVLLGAYKYTGFLADNINSLFGTHLNAVVQTYPVGLSFYTFIQIGFLIDASVGQTARPAFLRYALFGTFFPYVTAGPIVRRNEVLSQLDTPVRERTGTTQVAVGATMFAMGLFKKSVLADTVAPYATTLFNTASGPHGIGPVNAWLGLAAYTLQLYFDFSGYTDMAIGIAHMLGLRLPINFNSPLKATSVVDFWRRWHMTMTRFFTDFVYTPLAVSLMRRGVRKGYSAAVRVLVVMCIPMIVTFLFVGLWHGAGWGFVVWGAIQGVAISVNLVWREVGTVRHLPRIPSPVGWALTMATFMASLTFFRALRVADAVKILKAMVGLGPAGKSTGTFYTYFKVFNVFPMVSVVFWVALLTAIALLSPRNSQQLLEKYHVGLPTILAAEKEPRFRPAVSLTMRWAVPAGLMIGTALVFAGGPSPFLYYQF
jgi:D-alanyl-lipoteichoic acid acyltransferase DltB (MBOAT superfamily)